MNIRKLLKLPKKTVEERLEELEDVVMGTDYIWDDDTDNVRGLIVALYNHLGLEVESGPKVVKKSKKEKA